MYIYIVFTKQCEICLFLTWSLYTRSKRVILFTNGTDYKKQWQNKLVFNVNPWELKFQLRFVTISFSFASDPSEIFPSVQVQLHWVLADSMSQESVLKYWGLARLQFVKIPLSA